MEKLNNNKKTLLKRDKVTLKQKSDKRKVNYYESLLKKPNSLIVDINSSFIYIKYKSLLKICTLTSIKPCEAVEFALFIKEQNKESKSSVRNKIIMINEKIKSEEKKLPLLENNLAFTKEELKERQEKERAKAEKNIVDVPKKIKNQSSPIKKEEIKEPPKEKPSEHRQQIYSDLNLDVIDEDDNLSTSQKQQEIDEGEKLDKTEPEKNNNVDETKKINNQSSPVKHDEIKESPKKPSEQRQQIYSDLDVDVNDEEDNRQQKVDEDKELVEIKKNGNHITPKKEEKININPIINIDIDKNNQIPKDVKIDIKNKDDFLHIQNKYKSNVLNNMNDNHNLIKKNPLLFVKFWESLYLILAAFGVGALVLLVAGYIKMKKISFRLSEILLISEIILSTGLGIADFRKIQNKELSYFTLINIFLIIDSALYLFCLLTPIVNKITDIQEFFYIYIPLSLSWFSIIFNLLGITVCISLIVANISFLDFEKFYENAAKQSEGESLIDKNEEEIKKETIKI